MDHRDLERHLRDLVQLDETEAPLLSVFLNLNEGLASARAHFDQRVRILRHAFESECAGAFLEAVGRIEGRIEDGFDARTRGVAIYARAGSAPIFTVLEFRVPVVTWVHVDTLPNIVPLVELKDRYHRYVVLITNQEQARILEVSLGDVTRQLWTERPELLQRVGREWTREHYQSHLRDRNDRFIGEKIGILDRVMTAGGHTHLVLAGDARMAAAVRRRLPKRLEEKLIEVTPARGRTQDVVEATLAAFIDHERQESFDAVDVLEREVRRNGLAVVGVEPSRIALERAQVDMLLIATHGEPSHFVAPTGESCKISELVRLAERTGARVEFVEGSDRLRKWGGVGCLLRFDLPDEVDGETSDEQLQEERSKSTSITPS